MTYARFGMDVAGAVALTGDGSITDADLTAAESDLVDLALGYRPTWHDPTPSTPPERDLAFGRAVAWQATHRDGLDEASLEPGVEVRAETWPDHGVTYADGRGPTGPTRLSPTAVTILRRHGWLRSVGYTHGGTGPYLDDRLWHRIG